MASSLPTPRNPIAAPLHIIFAENVALPIYLFTINLNPRSDVKINTQSRHVGLATYCRTNYPIALEARTTFLSSF